MKEKLRARCFDPFEVSIAGAVLFKAQKSGCSLSISDLHNTVRWKCIMIQTKDIPEYLKKTAVAAHQPGNVYQTIFKEF